jgi:rubrerythrin
MSEEKKASEKLLERMDKLETNLKTLIEANKPLQPTPHAPEVSLTPSKDEAEAPKSHATVEEMLACKDCGKEARERILTPLHGQKIVKCKGCGSHVGEKEEKCPSCGSTSAE